MKTIQFFSRLQKVLKKLIFLIKIIYKILCIIKKYIKFGNYFFSFKKNSNSIFSTVQSKTPRNISNKIIKLTKTTIQIKKKGKNKTHIKFKLILPNM